MLGDSLCDSFTGGWNRYGLPQGGWLFPHEGAILPKSRDGRLARLVENMLIFV